MKAQRVIAAMLVVAVSAGVAAASNITLLSDNFDLVGSFKEPNLNDYTTNPNRQTGDLANLTWESYYDGTSGGNYIFIQNNALNMYGYINNPGTNKAMLQQNFNSYSDITFSVDVQDLSSEGYERYAGLVLSTYAFAGASGNWPTLQLADGRSVVYCYPGNGTEIQVPITPNQPHNLKIRLYDDGTGNKVVDMFVDNVQVGTSGMDANDANLGNVYCTLAGDMPYSNYGTILYDNFEITTIPEPATCGLVIMGLVGIIMRRKA